MNLWELPFKKRRDIVVRAWLKNLRSGKFKQGRNCLCLDGKYCCLGVLCETVLELDPDFMSVEQNTFSEIKFFGGNQSYLPEKVARLLGMTEDGQVRDERGFEIETLTVLNDDKEWTFEQIADFIDGHVDWMCSKDQAEYIDGKN